MFVPIILDFENNGLKFILLKYLRFLDYSLKNNWSIITHEEFDRYELNFPNRKEYTKEMQNKYGYAIYDYVERNSIYQCFLPGSVFRSREMEFGSELDRALFYLNNRDYEFEKYIKQFLDNIRINCGEDIEGVLYFASCPLSLKQVCEELNIPMISYETGPIRTPNYRCNTSYFCMNGLYGTDEVSQRWEAFKHEVYENDIPIFSREELITMFISHKYLGYIDQIDREPKYAMGVAGGCALVVPYFAISKYTDHELIDDLFEIYSYGDVNIRLHPGDMYGATYRLNEVDKSSSPFPFLIDSKRIAAVGSNMLFEAMLWKRIACCKTNVMPATIMCSKNYREKIEKKDTELFVNFFIFSFLVPSELATDEEYMRWRLSNPSETAIFNRNLEYYMKAFSLNEIWILLNRKQRLEFLKMHRNYKPMDDDDFEKSIIRKKLNESHNTDVRLERIETKETLNENNDTDVYLRYLETKEWLDSVLNSTSWKITQPLRYVLDKLRGLR